MLDQVAERQECESPWNLARMLPVNEYRGVTLLIAKVGVHKTSSVAPMSGLFDHLQNSDLLNLALQLSNDI